MVARHYQDLVCWQLANELKRRVYAFIARSPVGSRLRILRSDTRRSARSARRNIAEGFGRYRLRAEFARFLLIARGLADLETR